jgi:hypothetical protein
MSETFPETTELDLSVGVLHQKWFCISIIKNLSGGENGRVCDTWKSASL